MMRSLFSGVSGLKNHQTRMDVIGNNISNVNTTGFKSSRVTFSDTLNQTMTGAAAPNGNLGGTNPKQIGLGSSVSSIDLLFTDGSVQSTGKNTDLCLSGNGLFVISSGSQTYYTRNGAFEFDAEGNYVIPGSGMLVQGWTATDGVLNTSSAVGKINVPAGKSMQSEATTLTTYSNNLDASTIGYEISGIQVYYADGTSETVPSYTPTEVSDGKITLTTDTGSFVLDDTADYEFKTGDNLAAMNKRLWTSTISSVTANATGTVDLTLGSDSLSPTLTSVNPPIAGLTSGTYSIDGRYTLSGTINTNGVVATGTDNDPVEITFTTSDGHEVKIITPVPESGTYKDGDEVSFSFPITAISAKTGANANCANGISDPLQSDLNITVANQPYERISGRATDGTVTAITRDGNGSAYKFNDKIVSSVSINTSDGKTLSALNGQSYLKNGTFYPSITTTTTIFDSLGASHSVPVLFTKTDDNTWELSLKGGGNSCSITEDDGTITEVALTKSTLKFDTSGKYISGSASLNLVYENGAAEQNVAINLAAITQFSGNNTINASYNGHSAGTLESVSIDASGVITGTYTNGVRQAEAQVAVAQFTNASGLTKTGSSLYQESNNSGTANVKTAADLGVKITASALEMSNVDIANEFADMIVTQRGFQSNSKIITVGDEMLETVINMKR